MKTSFINALQIFSLMSLPAVGQIPLNGLTGRWMFNGDALDLSTSANHGSVNGAVPTKDRFGVSGHAYNFDGVNDYIVMLSAGPTGSVSRSVSFWSRSTNQYIQVPYGYGEAGAPGGIYQVVYNYGCTGVGFDNSQDAYIRPSTKIIDDDWHHVVYVYDQNLGNQIGNIKIYVDTVLINSSYCSGGFSSSLIESNALYPITIGKSSNSSLRYFKGDLDDFYEYNRPLSFQEVKQLFLDLQCTGGKPGPTGAISGNGSLCFGSPQVFSVTPLSNATNYSWYLPGGWSGYSTSNTITVTPNISGGNVSVAAVNGCGTGTYTSRYISAGVCTAINEVASGSPIIYPNPTNGILTFSNLPERCEISVSDPFGLIVRQVTSENAVETIDCKELAPGLYVVVIYSSGKVSRIEKVAKY
jgi:hypothetical protein